ncbi:beta strand repeat-containing protein, partial [Ensifer sp.]|uniref:beta strand repeat-containing protein n=1 Tax=Ensifer sp. TaxID=1872086 RepID=UPI002E12EFC3|nr:putative Ig domain-containing protein [Ensifer sp.]
AFTPAAGALAGATVADAYDLTIAAANGAAPYSYAVTGGALPAGLTLAADGRLSGTPTADGAATFTVTATDANNATGTASYSLAVAVQAPSAGPATATVAANSTANVMPLNLTGGAAASVTVATAPAHGTATATGTVISYTPMAGYSGADSFTYTATNATGTSAPATVTVTVSAPTFAFTPAAGALAGATVADAYDLTIAAANGASPYTYAVTGGALPAGLTLAADGRLSGTPTAGGPATFTVTATDANNATGTASYSLAVAVEAPSAGATSATVAANSSANAITPNLSGGSAASVTVATAPAHGTATATGTVISYTPVAGYSGADSFTYTATNATGTSAPATVTVTVSAPTLVFTPAAGALAGAAVAEAYDLTVAAANGTAPYGYAITAGTLPPGLTLSAGGRISGAPTTVGASAFTVTATDANGAIGAASYSLAVAIQAPVAGPVTAVVAGDSSVNVIAANLTGGAATSIAVASPPAHGTASVSGTTFLYTPAVGYFGSDRFTYTATNATGTSAPATVDVTVSPLPLTFSPVSGPLPAAAVGVSYSRTITASGGAAPYRYAISSGALPGGLTLDGSSGTISGTPIADGDFAFSVSAMDAIGAVAQASYRITVASASFVFTPSSGSLADAMVGEAYSQRISATGGTGALVYSLKSGALPKGMVL